MAFGDRFFKFDHLDVPDPKDAPKTTKFVDWLWFFSKNHKFELIANWFMHLGRHIFFMSITLFFTKIAELYETGAVEESPDLPFLILALYLGLSIFCYLLWVFIIRRVAINDKISREMSMFAIRHFMTLSLSWHELSGSGGKMQRITTARTGLFELFGSIFWDGAGFLAMFVSIFIAVYIMKMPDYFIILLCCYVISYMFVSFKTGNWLIKPTNRYFKSLEILNSKVYEFVNSIATVKVFNLHHYLMRLGGEKERAAHSAHVDAIKLRALRWGITDCLATLWIVAVAAIALYEVNKGNMTISAFVLVVLFMNSTWERLEGFTRIYGTLVEHYTAVKRLINNLVEQPAVSDKQDAEILKLNKAGVEFHQIGFNYIEDKSVLSNVSLKIEESEKIGLIGASGAGKTTLAKLLVRFYDLDHGCIRIAGTDIRSVTLESLREHIAIIPQDIALFNHSVIDNIRYGRLNASDEEVIEAAKKAYAHDFISELPDGYETLVGERGVKLSGGQRQRIAIARAILKDAPILILDEATSALDSESERLIQDSLKELMKGKTVIAIAHRLSTINHLDRLIVMDQGQIVEDGTHDDLLKAGGLYAKLWSMQSGGFLGE